MSEVPGKVSKPPARKTDEGTEFIVKLSGIKLSTADEERIANEIGAVVLRELGKVDAAPKSGAKGAAAVGGGTYAHIRPPDWLGYYIRRLGDEQLRSLDIPQGLRTTR